MDFKNYAGGNKSQFVKNNFSEGDVENVNRVVNKYSGKSEDAIMNDLISMVTQQRKEGKLSDRDLDNFAQNAGGMMSPEQRARLMSIIKTLKQSR